MEATLQTWTVIGMILVIGFLYVVIMVADAGQRFEAFEAQLDRDIQTAVLERVKIERERQDAIHGKNRIMPSGEWLAIMTEEVGEVARAMQNKDAENLRAELVQVAAVAVCWLESLE